MNDKKDDRLGDPIFLNYNVNKISKTTITQKIMLEKIKKHFEKHGFEKTEKINEGFIIFRKKRGENHDS